MKIGAVPAQMLEDSYCSHTFLVSLSHSLGRFLHFVSSADGQHGFSRSLSPGRSG